MIISAVKRSGVPLVLLLLATLPGRGQDSTSVQSPGRSGLIVGIAPAGELRRYSMTQEVFVGSPDCGLFETGSAEAFGLSLDLLMPTGERNRSGPGLSFAISLATLHAEVEAPQNYTFTTIRGGERSLVEVPHTYALESRSTDVGADLFWDLFLRDNLWLRAGLGASFSLPGRTEELDRIEHDVYRFEEGLQERSLVVAGPGFPSMLVGPLLGIGYRIESSGGVTVNPGIVFRLGINPDDGGLTSASVGARLGVHLPIREPLDPLAATLAIGDRDHPRSGAESGELHLVVVDSYEREGAGEWRMNRVVDPPTMRIGPRWEGAAGGGIASWSIVIDKDEGDEVLLSAASGDRLRPGKIDWKIPAEGELPGPAELRAKLRVEDSTGRHAETVEYLPLHLHHLVRFRVRSPEVEAWLISLPDSATLALRRVGKVLAGSLLDRLGAADTIYLIAAEKDLLADSLRMTDLVATLRPDIADRPEIRLLDDPGVWAPLVEVLRAKELSEGSLRGTLRGTLLIRSRFDSSSLSTPE